MSENPLPMLPPPLKELRFLAYNLRWSWHPETRELFRRVDPLLWDATRRNPVRLLAEVSAARLEELARDREFSDEVAGAAANLRSYLSERETWYGREHRDAPTMRVAYFSAEFGITECLPIFSGGLGVLAGDHLKSASDLGVPLVGVGLLYREGYFTQQVGRDGRQREAYPVSDPWRLPLALERAGDGAPLVVAFPFRDRRLHAQVWRADVGRVPLYLLDTDLDANRPEDRRITDRLYGGDVAHRLQQEIVLGIGGMRALEALGRTPDVVHLNEGHAAFAAVERVRRETGGEHGAFPAAAERLADGIVFTTHTPVAAGHDYFEPDLLERYLGGYIWKMGESWDRFLALGRRNPSNADEPFCMTTLALRLSRRRNGVSRLHGTVSRRMWRELWPERAEAEVPIGHVTNGVHLPTWVSPPMARVYSTHVGPAWLEEVNELRWQRASHLPLQELWAARREQRAELIAHARRVLAAQVSREGQDPSWTESALDPEALTIVFARRFATYKRATLLFSDPARLTRLLTGGPPVQFVFAGKAHPRDEPGKEFLRRIAAFGARPEVRGRFVFLENYDVELARFLVHGADVWLNVPRRPHEASGTSGMKAAANGALNLSIPDGWWVEAWREHNRLADPVGWCIEAEPASSRVEDQDRADAQALFALLEQEVVPLFHDRNESGIPVRWLERVRASVRQLVPFFNTHRMVRDYLEDAYLPAIREPAAVAGRLSSTAATRR